MGRFNIHGWEHLSGDNSEVVAARNEVLRQLRIVPEPHQSRWEKRLKSKQDHSHFSVHLEIYLHHFFKDRGWKVDIEPKLPSTCNHPDFVVRMGRDEMMVEAKTVLGAESERQQDDRLMQLIDDLSGKLNRTVLIRPMLDLPSSLPIRRIAAEIETRASKANCCRSFPFEGEQPRATLLVGSYRDIGRQAKPICGCGRHC